jgi:protein-tyrosine phosphatase
MTEPTAFRILAVCSGNVCRSPFVELLLRERLAARADIVVASAGTIARPGQRMTHEMVASAARHGVAAELSRAHGASRLDERTVQASDLILGLTRAHRSAAVELHPRAVRRAFTLTEFARLCAATTDAARGLTAQELVADAAARRGLVPVDAGADDIDDPIGLPQDVYDRVASEVATAIDAIARVLMLTRPALVARADDGPNFGGPDLSFSFRRL